MERTAEGSNTSIRDFGNGNYQLHFVAAPIIVAILCPMDRQFRAMDAPSLGQIGVDDASLLSFPGIV